jgi:predicted glutamine amidotransferase
MMALMGLNGNHLSDFAIYDTTFINFTNPCLQKLKQLGATNPHGWSLAWYDYSDPGPQLNPYHIVRSNQQASADPMYNDTVSTIKIQKEPRILLGHVRYASSGPSTIPDPHPFIMEYGGRDYSFMHNGSVTADNIITLINSLDSNWLTEHPLTTGVDSETYFSWIMLNIHLEKGNVLQGLKNALLPIYSAPSTYGNHINFILSDGLDIYAYKQTSDNDHPLAYFFDVDCSTRNHFLAGVMSEFADSTTAQVNLSNIEWESDKVIHEIENNELVFISSTGNIVRLPDFAHDDGLYTHKLGFHQGVNWTGFPIMKTPGTAPMSDVLNYFTDTDRGGLGLVTYGDGYFDIIRWINEVWHPVEITLNQKQLYKLTFASDSPSIHTSVDPGPMTQACLVDPSALSDPLLSSIVANERYWVSYTLLPSQNIKDAFGDSWANVKSVRAEDWFYSIPLVNPKGDPLGSEPLYSWITKGKNMDFGKGYIVTFKNNQNSFTWNRSYAPELPTPGKEKAVCFTWEDTPDYVVIDVVDIDNADTIQEIGVLQDGTCIGAVNPDSFPCQILAYPDYENPSPLTFEIVYNTKAQPSSHYAYELLDLNNLAFSDGQIIAEKDGLYQVKLNGNGSGDSDSAVSIIRTMSNYPNPFNPNTNISFTLTAKAEANVLIYNIKGQIVREMGRKPYNVGINTIKWDGRDSANNPVSSGIYFIRINTESESHTHKMLMLK